MDDHPDLPMHPLARMARERPRMASTALDEDVVQAAGMLRRRIVEFIDEAMAGKADSIDYRMAADEIETSAATLAQAMRIAAGTMQHRAVIEQADERDGPVS